MKKAVLFITNAYPDFETSSRGIFIRKMAFLLQREGYQITILTPKIYKKSRYVENQNGIKVYRFPFFAGDKLLIEYERIPYLRMILYYISGFLGALYILFRYHFHLIHVHWAIPTGPIGILAGTIFKKPLIVTIHGSDFRMAMEENSSTLKRIFMYICKKASHINCVSKVQLEKMREFGIYDSKLSIIPMGIEEDFSEKRLEKKDCDRDRPITVISNRNLLPIYNVSQLIQAIPLVLNEDPSVRFIIVGDGQEREGLERKVQELKIESTVHFMGAVPHERMIDLLSEADIYVSTSLSDGTSVSLLEAMAAGVFPVVSDIPANRDWIEDGKNGFLFPINDEKTLAKKILNAIYDKGLIMKGRELNRSIVEEKALWPVCIEKIKEIYDRVTIMNNKK